MQWSCRLLFDGDVSAKKCAWREESQKAQAPPLTQQHPPVRFCDDENIHTAVNGFLEHVKSWCVHLV